ncbi:hypothetical protein EAE96_002903 [Botrytis aclada]|nr:hypothetical protein EAE96_002903 [Botrytis aclada]
MDELFKTWSETPITLDLKRSLENGEALMQQIIGQIVLHPNSTQKSIKEITLIHEKFMSLLLTTPAPSLVLRYGPSGAAVTFHSLKFASVDSGGKIMISHLWKYASGFLLVDDSFTFEKPQELRFIETDEGAPLNSRRITVLGRNRKELFVESMKCHITVTDGCLVMFTTHDRFAKNSVSCFYIDGRGLKKLETAMSTPLRSDEDDISAEVLQTKDSDTEQNTAFDSVSQTTDQRLINTPAGTSTINEDRGFEAVSSTDQREASLKQREQEMDNREREIAEQERNIKKSDLVLADLQSSFKINITHLEATLSVRYKGFEEKLNKIVDATSSTAHPSPLIVKKNSLSRMTSPKHFNDGIGNFEVRKAELKSHEKALRKLQVDANARETALSGFQMAMERRERILGDRENSEATYEAELQDREKFVQKRRQELKMFSRELDRRDALLKERETELAARGKANIRPREQRDTNRATLEPRQASREQSLPYESYMLALVPMHPVSLKKSR